MLFFPGSCRSFLCNSNNPSHYQRLKIIQNTVRVPSSLYTDAIGSVNVYQNPSSNSEKVNWNQMSDRRVRHFQKSTVPSHGNSTRTTITRNRPGASSPGGYGVDIKHNSYYRYMNRLKGKGPILAQSTASLETGIIFNPAFPVYGGKIIKTGLVSRCICNK